MSCAPPSLVLRLVLLLATFIVSCSFVASVVWLLRTKGLGNRYENYYLSRINISAVRDVDSVSNGSLTPSVPDHYKDLIKIEIAMRRVEENSRRLKEYTKSLLWDNKDKSLWCVLFKDSERFVKAKSVIDERSKDTLHDEFMRLLAQQKTKETDVPLRHLRHHGNHHHRIPDQPDYIK